MLSIVLPTFNEMKLNFLPRILKTLGQTDAELICVDSGSQDGTLELLQRSSVKTISITGKTRAERLNRGIQASSHEMILLHHPRSLLTQQGLTYLKSLSHLKTWGGFTHRFDHSHPLLTFTSWYSNEVRGRLKAILYLDHCLFFHRSLLDEPIPPVPIFEDTYLSLNLRKKKKPLLLPFPSVTSSIRFRHNGVFKQALLNQWLKLRFLFKQSPLKMNQTYEKNLNLN